MAPLEVRVAKMTMGSTVPGGLVVVFNRRLDLPEAIQVELADKAREVGRLEDVVVRVVGVRRQDLSLAEIFIDDDDVAAAIPADGVIFGVVHQAPQFGGKVIRVDAVGERASTNIHAFICMISDRGSICETKASLYQKIQCFQLSTVSQATIHHSTVANNYRITSLARIRVKVSWVIEMQCVSSH